MAKGVIIWITGLSGSGKTTLSLGLAQVLKQQGIASELIDGDVLRMMNSDLSFSLEDRNENVRRASAIALPKAAGGMIVICAMVSPVQLMRDELRDQCKKKGVTFMEVYLSAPIETCMQRDPKNLYLKALQKNLMNIVGVDLPYEVPVNPELIIPTHQLTVEESVLLLIEKLKFFQIQKSIIQ